nr:capsid protein [Miltyush picorna-like virus 2]
MSLTIMNNYVKRRVEIFISRSHSLDIRCRCWIAVLSTPQKTMSQQLKSANGLNFRLATTTETTPGTEQTETNDDTLLTKDDSIATPAADNISVPEKDQTHNVGGELLPITVKRSQLMLWGFEKQILTQNIRDGWMQDSVPIMNEAVMQDIKQHTIKDFLNRQVQVYSFTVTNSSDSVSSMLTYTPSGAAPIFEASFPEQLLAGGIKETTQFYDKTKNFAVLRGDLVIRLVVNCQPFQAGLLRIVCVPWGDKIKARYQSMKDSGQAISQAPGFIMDIQEKVAEFKAPWTGPNIFQSLLDDQIAFKVAVYPYSKLCDAANEGITVMMYASLHNVELLHPVPYNPSNGPSPVKAYERAMQQHGPDQEATAAATSGSVSGACSTIGSLAGMASMIPGVGQFAGPISMVANTVGGIAKAFGHSKPMNKSLQNPIVNRPAQHMVNVDGFDDTHNLGISHSTFLDQQNNTMCVKDEMALSYISQIPTLVKSFDWPSSAAADTILFNNPVCPSGNIVTTVRNSKVIYMMSAMAFVAQNFAFWRGSITYKIRIIKTKFHSGQLRIGHIMGPNVTADFPSRTNLDFNKIPSSIWKIDESDTFEYTIQYGSNRQWKRCPTAEALAAGETFPTAFLLISVENPLRYTSTVPNHVEILIEERAGPDFQVAFPRAPRHAPVYYVAAAAPPKNEKQQTKPMTQHGPPVNPLNIGMDTDDQTRTRTKIDMPTKAISSMGTPLFRRTIAEQSCFGELVLSCRQLIKRAHPYIDFALHDVATWNRVLLQPNGLNIVYPVGQFDAKNDQVDHISQWQMLYLYRSGGVNIRAVMELGNDRLNHIDAYLIETTDDVGIQLDQTGKVTNFLLGGDVTDGILTVVKKAATLRLPLLTDLEGFASVSIPYYSDKHVLMNEFLDTGSDVEVPSLGEVAVDYWCPSNLLYLDMRHSGTATDAQLYRYAKDDFQLSGFLGVPGYIEHVDDIVQPTVYGPELRKKVKDRNGELIQTPRYAPALYGLPSERAALNWTANQPPSKNSGNI